MKNKKLLAIILLSSIILVGCSKKPSEEEEPPTQIVSAAKEGDYQMLTPFKMSPTRQIHAQAYREIDSTELGRRLLEKSKDHFSVKKYLVSEGQVLDLDRYSDLVLFKSDDNPDGLMTKYDSLEIDGVTLQKPIFITDIYELNFHTADKPDTIAGVSISLVLGRMQYTDVSTGAMHTLSDEALFNVGQTLGLQLSAYLRSIEGMSDIPIYIALYAQSSDMDKLPDNYLPGSYIGDGFSKGRSMQFEPNFEKWIMLSDAEASELLPQIETSFSQLKRKVSSFVGDESAGIIGKAFVVENKLDTIRLEVNAPSKTYLELHSLAQFIAQEIEEMGNYDVPIKVDIKVLGKTRIALLKEPGSKTILMVFE